MRTKKAMIRVIEMKMASRWQMVDSIFKMVRVKMAKS